MKAALAGGHVKSLWDIADVWLSSYSAHTNEILWGAKFAARMPWIACVVRLSSYECGMDQPIYSPVQQIVERSGTLFFSFQDLDSTKPARSRPRDGMRGIMPRDARRAERCSPF